jgi:drug/metabolite transporter (DMT)-like permease
MSRRWSLIAVVVSAACFGTLAVLTPLAYRAGALPMPLLAWRFVIAGTLIGVVATLKDRTSLVVPLADIGRFATLALTGYGAASVCFFYALKFASASVVAVLLYAYPAMVLVAGWLFLGERASWGQAAAVATTFAGCALVAGVGSAEQATAWQGVVLGLCAAAGYTLFNLLSARWLPGRSRLTMMAYTFGIAALLPALGAYATMGRGALSTADWDPSAWWLLAAIVLIPTFAAVILYLEGIRGLGPSQAAITSTFEPVFTMMLAAVVLGERLSPSQLAGAALVIGGVVVAELQARAALQPAAV